MSRKKLFVIILVNVCLLTALYFGLEFIIKGDPCYDPQISFLKEDLASKEIIDISLYQTENFPDDFKRLDGNKYYKNFCEDDRHVFNKESNKNPIMVIGCSYAYGHGLNRNETFPYLLSQLTNRPIYNFANCSANAYQNLYMINENLKRNPKLKDVYSKTDYVIYVYMFDHIYRYLTVNFMMEFYDKLFNSSKFGKLTNKLFVIRYIKSKIKRKIFLDKYPDISSAKQYLKSIMLNWYSYMKEIAPNAKFIFVLYDEKIPLENHSREHIKFSIDIINSEIWSEIEKETSGGIKVVHTKDLTGFYFNKDYKLKADISDWHPNNKVWKLLTPIIVKNYLKDL